MLKFLPRSEPDWVVTLRTHYHECERTAYLPFGPSCDDILLFVIDLHHEKQYVCAKVCAHHGYVFPPRLPSRDPLGPCFIFHGLTLSFPSENSFPFSGYSFLSLQLGFFHRSVQVRYRLLRTVALNNNPRVRRVDTLTHLVSGSFSRSRPCQCLAHIVLKPRPCCSFVHPLTVTYSLRKEMNRTKLTYPTSSPAPFMGDWPDEARADGYTSERPSTLLASTLPPSSLSRPDTLGYELGTAGAG
jgi:hypothetical protein